MVGNCRRMSTVYLMMVLVACLLLVGCRPKIEPNPPAYNEADVNMDGVRRFPMEGVEHIVIDDTPNSIVHLLANDEMYVLVNAGTGAGDGGVLLSKLKALHVRPEQVAAVCLTDFGHNRMGGLLRGDQPAFPNADVYVPYAELERYTNGDKRSENAELMEVLSFYAPRLQVYLPGDTLIHRLVADSTRGGFQLDTVFLN